MRILELFETVSSEFRDEKGDNSVLKLHDLRKSRLTLAHLNKLRMSDDIRKFEHEEKLAKVSKQYKPAPPAGPGMNF